MWSSIVSWCVYPFTCCWRSALFAVFGYVRPSCYEYSCRNLWWTYTSIPLVKIPRYGMAASYHRCELYPHCSATHPASPPLLGLSAGLGVPPPGAGAWKLSQDRTQGQWQGSSKLEPRSCASLANVQWRTDLQPCSGFTELSILAFPKHFPKHSPVESSRVPRFGY